MNYPLHRETRKGHTITIFQDQDAENPRDNAPLGTIVAWSRRFTDLGDDHDFENPDDACAFFKANDALVLPVYKYEHGSIALSTESFIGRAQHAEWDSGQVGFIYCLPEDVRLFNQSKRMSKQQKARALKTLAGEVETYSEYLAGNVYEYVIEGPDGEDIDSCCGLYGMDYAIERAVEAIDELTIIEG